MKKLKGLKIALFSVILCVLCIFTAVNTYALDQTITLAKAEKITTPYIGGVTFSYKTTTSGEYLYCLDMPKKTASNITANLVGKRDNGITTILLNGYPTKSITGNKEKDYYITQTAVWWYLDETTGSTNLGEQFKKDGSDSYNMRSKVKELVELGKANKNKEQVTASIKLSTDSTKLEKKDNYYVSSLIKITKTGTLSNIKVTLTNTPEGTLIVDASGTEITDFSNIEGFYIKIPADKVTSSNTYNVTIIGNSLSYHAYEYQPTDTSMQNVAKLVKEETEINDSISLSSSVEYIVVPDTSTTSLIITIVGVLVISTGLVVIKKHAK